MRCETEEGHLNLFSKPYRFAIAYSIVLASMSAYVLLDAFVIPKAGTPVVQSAPSVATQASPSNTASSGIVKSQPSSEAILTDNTYNDGKIQITIEKGRAYESNYYVADIQLTSAEYLKTALAQNTFGRNIKETTSEMAAAHNAILAINGDYYGFRDTGYVLRNGVLYRSASGGQSGEALLIDAAGDFSVAKETQLSAEAVKVQGIQQILSFGPGLVVDGQSVVESSDLRGQGAQSNPRTAIGQISPLHYIVLVVDGRTSASRGVTLTQLAELALQHDCQVAYNLDGGGSSAMVFRGQVVNNPTDGRTNGEREVSDIVYFGLE